MKTMKSYVKQVLAQLTGDQNTVVAEKNYRKASSAVKGQIASLEAKLVDDEQSLENAQEALNKAKYPTFEVSDQKGYVQNVVRATEAVEANQATLDSTKKSIEFFKSLLTEFDEEKEA